MSEYILLNENPRSYILALDKTRNKGIFRNPGWVDVRDYGARGNGTADDTAEIQSAIDAAHSSGVGVVYFPPGTYKISIQSGVRALTIYAGITLQGAGSDLTTIKLANTQGSYRYIFAASLMATDLSGFGMYDLCVDQNSTNNTTVPAATTNDKIVLAIFVGERLRVERCRFKDLDNMQTIDLNGTGIKNVAVLDNVFENTGNVTYHDHSTVYFAGDGALIAGNSFKANTTGRTSIANAIETHGSRVKVIGNHVKDYNGAANLTGTSIASDGVVYYGNVIEGVAIGIAVWSWTTGGLANCVIQGNSIRLSPSTWNTWCSGIYLDSTGTAGTRNVTIANNVIRTVGALGTTSASDLNGSGVNWYRSDQSLIDYNLHIIDNIVDGAMASGIRVGAQVQGLQVRGNTILNPGLSGGGFANDFRAGVCLAGTTMKDVLVSNNSFIDDQGTSTIKHGIRIAATTFTNAHIIDNTLRVADGTTISLNSPSSNQSFESRSHTQGLSLTDGITAPSTIIGQAVIYVDTADGDLKVKFGDGTVKTIVVDT
jgi:hypothetical protein